MRRLPHATLALRPFKPTGKRPPSRPSPNNSFKPNLLRYTKAMAQTACHGFGSTTQVGLTQALGPMWKIVAISVLLIGGCSAEPAPSSVPSTSSSDPCFTDVVDPV